MSLYSMFELINKLSIILHRIAKNDEGRKSEVFHGGKDFFC